MKKMKHGGWMLKAVLCIGILVTCHLSSVSLLAQKYACVNTDYILKSIPDYSTAQKRLDKYVTDWQKELQDKQSELETLRAEYEQESYLLPDNLKKRRQEEMKEKEQEIKTLQQQRFGAGGDLDKKRAELLKPIQDRVYSTIERVAHEKNYAFVFDKAASPTLLFANKKYDISDEVLDLLGYKPGKNDAAPAPTENGKSSSSKKPSNPEMRQNDTRGRNNVPSPLGGDFKENREKKR